MFRSIHARAYSTMLGVLLLAVSLNAGTPLIIPHQGRLLDAADTPLDGSYTITYSIFEASTGGSPLWTESHVGVVVEKGLFSVQLGSVVPLTADILTGSSGGGSPVSRYLEIQLAGQAPIAPRTQLGSSPYSVASSRVSGDIQTGPGRIVVGDLNGDGHADLIATPDSVVNDYVQDNSPNNESRVKIRVTPTDAGVSMGRSGSTTATIRTGVTGGHISLGGMSGSTTGTIRMVATPDSTRTALDSDNDGNGIPESSIQNKTSGPRATSSLSGMSGSTTGTIRMAASPDSALSSVEYDSDNDGVAESSMKLKSLIAGTTSIMGSRSGSTTGTIRMMATPDSTIDVFDVDSDNDGIPESSDRRTVSANDVHHNVISRSGSTTGTIRMAATPDSATASLDCDSDADGVLESSYRIVSDGGGKRADVLLAGRSGSTTGTIRMAASPDSAVSALETDADNDGLSERAVRMNAGHDELSVVVEYKDGDDPITHKRAGKQSASAAGARWSLEDDTDGNGDAECRAITRTGSTGASQGLYKKGLNAVNVRTAMVDSVGDAGFVRRIQWDIDNDGTYDMVSSSTGDASGTRSLLKGGMSGSTTGTIRMAATPDTSSSAVESDSDGDGNPESRGTVRTFMPVGIGGTNFGASSRMSIDSDDDGVEDMIAEMESNPDSACLRLNGLPPGTPYIGNLSMQASGAGASQVLSGHNGSTTGTIRMQATPDSGVVEVGYHGSTTGTIRMQASSSGSVNPIEHSSGAHLTAGGVWTNASDANLKENFRSVDGAELLKKIGELPVSQWNYKAESDEVTHIGPTAQDFQKVFGVGENDKTISTIDPSGIALAAIKELNKQNLELKNQNIELKKELDELKRLVKQIASKK